MRISNYNIVVENLPVCISAYGTNQFFFRLRLYKMGRKLKSNKKCVVTSKLSNEPVSNENSSVTYKANEGYSASSIAPVASLVSVQVSPLSPPQLSSRVMISGTEPVCENLAPVSQSSARYSEKHEPLEAALFPGENSSELDNFTEELTCAPYVPKRFKRILSQQLLFSILSDKEGVETNDNERVGEIPKEILQYGFVISNWNDMRKEIESLMSKFDFYFTIPCVSHSDERQAAKKADKQIENDEYVVEYLSEQISKFVEKYINLNKLSEFDDKKDKSEQIANIFLNGVPLIKDVKYFKKLWEEMNTSFSFHEDIWYYAISKFDAECLNKNKKSTDQVKNCKTTKESSPVSHSKNVESAKFKCSSKNRHSSSDVGVSEATKRIRISKAKAKLKQSKFKSPTGTSKGKFPSMQDNASDVSENKSTYTRDNFDTTPENSLPGLRFDSLDFPNIIPCEESAERNCSNSSEDLFEFIIVSDADNSNSSNESTESDADDDDDSFNHEREDESKTSKSNCGLNTADSSTSTSRPNYEANPAEMSGASRVIVDFRLMYDLNIEFQKAFKYLSIKSGTFLRFISTSPPEVYQVELLNYVNKMEVLRNLMAELKVLNQKLCKSLDIPKIKNVLLNYDIDVQVCLLKEKARLVNLYWILLKKYNKELSLLLDTAIKFLRR